MEHLLRLNHLLAPDAIPQFERDSSVSKDFSAYLNRSKCFEHPSKVRAQRSIPFYTSQCC